MDPNSIYAYGVAAILLLAALIVLAVGLRNARRPVPVDVDAYDLCIVAGRRNYCIDTRCKDHAVAPCTNPYCDGAGNIYGEGPYPLGKRLVGQCKGHS